MQVTNTYLKNIKFSRAGETVNTAQTGGSPPSSSLNQTSTHLPSEELARLLALARQEEPKRPNTMQEVARRLARGEMLTLDAATETAEAILRSGD